MKTTLLIMAAGIGSRFGEGIKQLEPVDNNNQIIMDYSISEGDTFQGERGSDVSETEDGGSTSVSSEVTAD